MHYDILNVKVIPARRAGTHASTVIFLTEGILFAVFQYHPGLMGSSESWDKCYE